uniref:Uncharacterized protein n=1 Tax=Gopherus evgoodei TaxID=1825980 RepID=A0A8C4WT52_9SAUR
FGETGALERGAGWSPKVWPPHSKAWLTKLRWWGPEAGKEGGLTEAPRKSQRWGAQRLLALIGWGRAEDPGPAPGESLFSRVSQVPQYLSPHQPPADVPEHFQICFNFSRHLFDLCVVTLLCACSPAFRLLLDILGFRGPLKVWLHGLATFLVTTYGMYLALWLVQKYLLQFACLYGFLQTLVLCVSIRKWGVGRIRGVRTKGVDLADGEQWGGLFLAITPFLGGGCQGRGLLGRV